MPVNTIDYTVEIDFIIDSLIKNDKKWKKKLCTNNKLKDFKVGDVVKCTFLKQLYTVITKNEELVYVRALTDPTDEGYGINPTYLKKIKVNDKLVKVLYETGDLKDR